MQRCVYCIAKCHATCARHQCERARTSNSNLCELCQRPEPSAPLETIEEESDEEYDVEGDNCPICLSTLEGNSNIKFECNHEIHLKCFMKYIKINPHSKKCPYCRRVIDC